MAYKQRPPVKFPDINFKGNCNVGSAWPVISTRTGEEYEVEMTDRGFTCTCFGFSHHGKCKHITGVYERFVAEEVPEYA